MPLLTLKDAAEYVRTSKAGELLLAVLRKAQHIFTFADERENRINRYVAVVNAYKSGMPIAAIEEKFGCSRRTIYDYLIRADIDRRRFIRSDTKAQVIELYKAGVPVTKIAELSNISLRAVMKIASDAGLSRKKKK